MTKQSFDGSLLQRASLFTLTLRAWGNRRKADLNKIEANAEKRMLRLSKRLVESKEYDAIISFQNEVKHWCLDRCMPSFIKDGIYVVVLTEIESFEKKLKDSVIGLESKLVPKFLQAYERQKEAAKTELGDQFCTADYPSEKELKCSFGIEWGWISFGVPENLPAGVREKEVKKIQKAFADAQEEIVAALREGFGGLVDHAVERLTVQPGEKPKIFKNSLFENFDKFFETFNARNLMNDKELQEVVDRAKGILAGVDPDRLRNRLSTRQTVAKAITDVKVVVDKLIQERPSRRFSFDD